MCLWKPRLDIPQSLAEYLPAQTREPVVSPSTMVYLTVQLLHTVPEAQLRHPSPHAVPSKNKKDWVVFQANTVNDRVLCPFMYFIDSHYGTICGPVRTECNSVRVINSHVNLNHRQKHLFWLVRVPASSWFAHRSWMKLLLYSLSVTSWRTSKFSIGIRVSKVYILCTYS